MPNFIRGELLAYEEKPCSAKGEHRSRLTQWSRLIRLSLASRRNSGHSDSAAASSHRCHAAPSSDAPSPLALPPSDSKQLDDLVHRLSTDVARLDHALLQIATCLDTPPLREDLRLARRRILSNVREVSVKLMQEASKTAPPEESYEPRVCFLFAAILEALLLRLQRALRLLQISCAQKRCIVTGTEERSRCFFAFGRSVPSSIAASRRVSMLESEEEGSIDAKGDHQSDQEEIRSEHREVNSVLEAVLQKMSVTATPWDALANAVEVEKRCLSQMSGEDSPTPPKVEEEAPLRPTAAVAPQVTETKDSPAVSKVSPAGVEDGHGGVRHYSRRKKIGIALAGLVGVALIISTIVTIAMLL